MQRVHLIGLAGILQQYSLGAPSCQCTDTLHMSSSTMLTKCWIVRLLGQGYTNASAGRLIKIQWVYNIQCSNCRVWIWMMLLTLNTLRQRQICRHFEDGIFTCIFLNENVWISLKISLKFVPKVQINKIPALIQIIALHRPGNKPLSELMMVTLQCIYVSLCLNELKETSYLVLAV